MSLEDTADDCWRSTRVGQTESANLVEQYLQLNNECEHQKESKHGS